MNKTSRLISNKYLMSEWNYHKNTALEIEPQNYTEGSGKMVWWICSKGHEWDATINSRHRGSNCPICANKKVLKGFNDFETFYPDIAKFWHPTKNGNMLPSDYTYGSGRKVWWICEDKHEYQRTIRDSIKGDGCPKCKRIFKTSFPEQAIYYYIKKAYSDAINSYSEIFDNNMELDVYIPSLKVGIEYDGSAYHTKNSLQRDNLKYQICHSNGIMLVRIFETSETSLFRLCDYKIEVPNGERQYLDQVISQLCFYLGKPQDVNINRDKFNILEYLTHRSISFASKFPDLAIEWDYEKNDPLKPENFSPFSNESVFWRCSICGKQWKTSIATRASSNNLGCKQCRAKQGRKKQIQSAIKINGSFGDYYSELLDEWDFESNRLNPYQLLPNSTEVVSWICKKCGYHWKADIAHRTRGHGCSLCSNQIVVAGINDLKTVSPELAEEWNYDKNLLAPSEVSPNSNTKFWWKCSKCSYEWEAMPHNRFSKKSGCPCCSGRVAYKGVNDFKTLYPLLARDWDYSRNLKLPEEVKPKSHYLAYWKCVACGYEWEKTVYNRVRNPKCPKCCTSTFGVI